jgi:pimeloyl-ACP methyl ester carboxylesterase
VSASFLPSIAALAPHGRRVIAADLPGFGDSAKPIAARYDPKFFSQAVVAMMDALGLDRTDIVGHSLGGRVTLEVVMYAPERFRHAVLMTPSLAWLRERPLARWLRLVRPELGLLQPAPRPELFWTGFATSSRRRCSCGAAAIQSCPPRSSGMCATPSPRRSTRR